MDLKKFEDWLESHSVLNDLTRFNYVCGVRKFINETSIVSQIETNDFVAVRDTITMWLLSKPRAYSRKNQVKYLLQYYGKQDWIKELSTIFKRIKMKDRRHNRNLSLKDWVFLIQSLEPYLNTERKRREQHNESEKKKRTLKLYPKFIELMLPVLLQVLYDTGARAELLKIKPNDIKNVNDAFTIADFFGNETKQKTNAIHYITFKTKGGKIFSRYIEESTHNKLQDLIDTLNVQPNEYIFFDHKIRITQKQYQKRYYEFWSILKNASRKLLNREYGISFHWTRTSRAKGLIQSGNNIVEVKTFLGHANINTTMRYVEFGEDNSQKIIEKENKW